MTTVERFIAKTVASGECLLWTGSLNARGYGEFWFRGAPERAHRASWVLAFGDIPLGMFVCHHCDNRRCVRPDHLFLGTPADNSADMVAKGRQNRGERQHAARLAAAQVREIRTLLSGGHSRATVAMRFGVTTATIRGIHIGMTWRHVA
jgi:hypothetical protein